MEITHKGRITDITPQTITVEIISESACSACHAQSLCSLSESTRKIIQVPFDFRDWELGQEVDVCMRRTMGFKAVWIAYVIPLFVMFAVMMTLTALGVPELWCGLGSIVAVALYYFAIFLFRNRLRNQYTFYIK